MLSGRWKGATHKRATTSPGVTVTKVDDTTVVVRFPAGTGEFTIAAP